MLARNNLSLTKKKYHTNVDEEVHLALHWSIEDTTESRPVTTAKIRNDDNKVGFLIMFLVTSHDTFFILD